MAISERATPPPPASLQSVLEDWRAADRALISAPPGSEAWQRASADFKVMQAQYHDVADHGMPDQRGPGRPLDLERDSS
jgi:hypothetical protein